MSKEKLIWVISLIALASFEAPSQGGLASEGDLCFDHLSLEDGLPHPVVNCVIQDRQGFMWFGSHGLCKYDGQRIKVYKPRIPDPGAMLFDVRVIIERSDGILWMGTNEAGLARFDPITEQFTVFQYNQDNPTTLSDKSITAVLEDREGILWAGTSWNGINRFDPKTLKITRYPFFSNQRNSGGLYGRSIQGICEDSAGRIWVATDRGVSLLNPATDQFTHFENNGNSAVNSWPDGITSEFLNVSDGHFLIGTGKDGVFKLDPSTQASAQFSLDEDVKTGRIPPVAAICKDHIGHIWIGTRDGLLKMDENRVILNRYRHNPSNVRSLGNNQIQCLYQDRSGLIWVGTTKGISRFDPSPQPLTVLSRSSDGEPEKPFNNVSSISEDATGGLWIGTWNDGLHFMDSRTGQWQYYRHNATDPNSISHNRVNDVHISHKNPNIVWIGHAKNAISRLDLKTGQITQARQLFDDRNTISDGRVNCLFEDREGTLWIGTWFGLNWIDQNTLQCRRYQPDASDHELSIPVHISAIAEDASGALWVGTRIGGLYRLDRASGEFARYQSDPNNPRSLSHDHIRSIHEDSQNRLWIATRDGLSHYDPGSDSFARYLCADFPFGEQGWAHRNDIQGVLEDDHGHLWVGSQDGLHVLSLVSESSYQARHIETLSGQRIGTCRPRARLKGRDGTLYFGTTNGLFALHPELMRITDPPAVVLTDLKLFHESVTIAPEGTLLTKHLSACKEVTLGHDQRVITIDFAALDYTDPSQNQYAYMLEGLMDDWVYLNRQASVTFTNLDPGEYMFRVKAANSHGVWNEVDHVVQSVDDHVDPGWHRRRIGAPCAACQGPPTLT
jgi:ligand-binding sensor domain-containing protein